MSESRDFDRTVRAWLDLMPDHAPDRSIAAVLQAAEVTPQVRLHLGPALRRSPQMTRSAIAAALAAIIVAAIGGAILVGGGPGPGPSISSTPVASASPTDPPARSAGTGLPSPLWQVWIGAPRDVPDLGMSSRTSLVVTGDTIGLTGRTYVGTEFASVVSADGETFEVTSEPASSGDGPGQCAAGNVGRYTWALSPSGSRLTVTLVDDACAARTVAFAGDWFRVGCKAENTCFGPLDPGTYPTVNFGPLLDPAVPPSSDFGELTYTVPEGWAIASDHTSDIRLVTAADYALETRDGPPSGDSDAIEAWVRPAAISQTDPCIDGAASPAQTPQALAEAIVQMDALDASPAREVTIGGRSGWMTDVAIAPSHTETCGFPRPVSALLTEAVGSGGSVGPDPYVAGIMAPARMRLIFLDLGSGRTVAILIRSVDPAAFDAWLAQAMPIVESFRFQAGPGA